MATATVGITGPSATSTSNSFYFKDTDGQGWRTCSRCHKRGIKDTFYGRNKEFCSIGCSRTSNSTCDYLFRNRNKLPLVKNGINNLIDLTPVLEKFDFAPVHCFSHAPLSRCWQSIFHHDCVIEIVHESTGEERVWLAKVLQHRGYFIKVKLVGKKRFYFLNPGQVNLYPAGYALRNKKRYGLPFKGDAENEQMFQEIEYTLKNCSTISFDLFNTFKRELINDYDRLMTFEVIDKGAPYQFITGRVRNSYGDWVYIKYDHNEDSLWVHPNQGYFRPPGWCQLVGHPIRTTASYATNSLLEFSRDPSIQLLFAKHLLLEPAELQNNFEVGMKLEVLDTFDHVMRVATVERILRMGFMIIHFDHDEKSLVFHITSQHLYPSGFSSLNGIIIHDSEMREFNWSEYRFRKGESQAPIHCFSDRKFNCRFKQGMIIETFNLRGHGVIAYAIILRVAGRVLLIDFIHNSTKHGLLVDCESPCLYPVGHLQMLQHRDRNLRFDNMTIEEFKENVTQSLRELQQYEDEAGLSDSYRTNELTDDQQGERLEVMPDIEQMNFSDADDIPMPAMEDCLKNQEKDKKLMNNDISLHDNNPIADIDISSRKLSEDSHSEIVKPQSNIANKDFDKLPIENDDDVHMVDQSRNEIEEFMVDRFISLMETKNYDTGDELCNSDIGEFRHREPPEMAAITFSDICEKNRSLLEADFAGGAHMWQKITDYKHWSTVEVYRFLENNMRLRKYSGKFIEKNVNGARLLELADDLEQLNQFIPLIGDQLKLRFLVEKLRKRKPIFK